MIKYNLTVTEEQAEILIKALDLYSRIGMGQLGEILDHHRDRMRWGNIPLAKEELDSVSQMCTGLPKNSYYSISSREISNNYRIAYDIQQTLRYRLAWDKNPEGGQGVWFHEPMNYSGIDFPTLDVVAGDNEISRVIR